MTAATVQAGEQRKHLPLLSGEPVRFRLPQMLAWGIFVGLLGTCFAAGLYYALWEVNWFVHIGPVHFRIFYLKPWWDAGSLWPHWLGHWPVYRHAAFRDLLEPELFIMAIGTLMAKPAHWDDRCPTWRLIISPVILVVLALVLNIAGVWLLDYGLPASAVSFFARASIGTILLGFIIGHFALRPFWAPVGALLQGNSIDQSVARAKHRDRIPLWETYPLLPPVVRERFAYRWRHWTGMSWVSESDSGFRKFAHRSIPYVLSAVSLIILLVTVLGGMAKYGFAHGWHVAYLRP